MFKIEYVEVAKLKPGMRFALLKRDGSVEPTDAVVRVEIDEYDGAAEIVLDSGRVVREDGYRMANDAAVAIAVEVRS